MMPSKIEAPMWDHYRVKHAWNKGKSNGKIAVSMCDHYGVEAQKKHGRNEQNRLYGATVGIVEGAFG